MQGEEALDTIVDALTTGDLESWFEGKTLTVMIAESEELHLVMLRLAGFSTKPSRADLRGEPA